VRELFIYYRAEPAAAPALQAAVQAWEAQLRLSHPGLLARLLRRPEPDDGWHTWMETYAMPASADGLTPALQDEIEQSARSVLAPWTTSARHVEVFHPCAS